MTDILILFLSVFQ